MATVYIGLGSNLGHREANLEQAMRLCAPEFQITKVSPIYETNMLYRIGRPRYFNMVCRVETHLTPELAFEKCQTIERAMGRTKAAKYDPRVIDVDLLLYDSIILRTQQLTIPHPRMHERAFVLVPLSKIGGSVVHPVLRRTIHALADRLGDHTRKIGKIEAM